jgi:hypothetical protein
VEPKKKPLQVTILDPAWDQYYNFKRFGDKIAFLTQEIASFRKKYPSFTQNANVFAKIGENR